MIITKRFFIPLLFTLVRAEDVLSKEQLEDFEKDFIGFEDYDLPDYYIDEDLNNALVQDMDISDYYTNLDQDDMVSPEESVVMFEGRNETEDVNQRGLRGINELNPNVSKDLEDNVNSNSIIDSFIKEHNTIRNLDIEEDNVLPWSANSVRFKYPEIWELIRHHHPLFDFDGDGCLPAAAIGKNGDKNGGLKTTGSFGGKCRSSNFLDRSNTYIRWAPIEGKGTIIMFALYFEKDQATLFGGGHRHDWEDVIIWFDEHNKPKKVFWSAHGDYTGKNWADVPKMRGYTSNHVHPKIVYHRGASTHSFRLAKSGENSAENPYRKWVIPPAVGWYEMTGNGLSNSQMRDLMNNYSYGSAITGFKDGRFQQQIEKCIGKEVDMKLVNAYPHAIKSSKRLNVHESYEISAHLDEKSYIIAQGDDNIVIYTNGRATWASATVNRCDSENIVYFQGDGNLVFYCKGKGAVWALGYSGSSGPYYLMAEHGRPVVKTYKGVTVRKL